MYDSIKSPWRSLVGDADAIKPLRKLAKEISKEKIGDRELSADELYKIFHLVLTSDKKKFDKAVSEVFDILHRHHEYQAAAFLYDSKPSSFNENNLRLIMEHREDLYMIIEVWTAIPTAAKTQQNLELIIEQEESLYDIFELLKSSRIKQQLETNSNENFLKLCFISMLAADKPWVSLDHFALDHFPPHLITHDSLKKIRGVLDQITATSKPINFSSYDEEQVFKGKNIILAKEWRVEIMAAVSILPTTFQTPETLSLLCKQTTRIGKAVSAFMSLPEHLWTSENLEIILSAPDVQVLLAKYFRTFFPLAMQTSDNFLKLFTANMDYATARIIESIPFSLFNMLMKEDFEQTNKEKLEAISKAYSVLPRDLKTQENINLLKEDKSEGLNAKAVHFIFSAFQAELRNQENFALVIKNSAAISKLIALGNRFRLPLHLARISRFLNQDALNEMINQAKLPENSEGLSNLARRYEALATILNLIPDRLKTQNNYDNLVNYTPQIVRFRDTPEFNETTRLISGIPEHMFTAELANHIIECARANNQAARQVAFNRLRVEANRITVAFNGPFRNVAAGNINPSQSTHTASVHASVSESAIKLINRYGHLIDTDKKLDETLQEMVNWSRTASAKELKLDEHQFAKAKLSIQHLADPTYAYTDPKSQVSTRQLLALVWIGIHDKELCSAPLNDALEKMIIGLYDIQRGYNLTADFKDLAPNDKDKIICSGGTFNKLMEIPWGMHDDVTLRYITSERASAKFPIMVKDLVQEHIDEIKHEAKSEEDHAAYMELVAKLNDEGIDPIWDNIIKPRLLERFYDEYGSLYKSKDDAEFINFVEQGHYVDLASLHLEKIINKGNNVKEKNEEPASDSDSLSVNTLEEKHSGHEETKLPNNDESTSSIYSSSSSFFNKSPLSTPKNNETSKDFSLTWKNAFINSLNKEITYFNSADKSLCKDLQDLQEFIKRFSPNNPEHIQKIEINLSHSIGNLTKKNSEDSPHQKGYQRCLDMLLIMQKGVPKLKSIANEPLDNAEPTKRSPK